MTKTNANANANLDVADASSNKTDDASPLINPYKGIAPEVQFRLNVDVTIEDAMTIKSISPSQGSLQTIVALYVKSIIADLNINNIKHYSPANSAKFKRLVLRRTAALPAWDDSGSDGLKPKEGVHQTRPDLTHLAADPQSEGGTRLKGGTKVGVGVRGGTKGK